MRTYLLAIVALVIAGCGGAGGGGSDDTRGANGAPLAERVQGPWPFIDFRGASKVDSEVTSTIDPAGAIVANSFGNGLKKITLTLDNPQDLSYADILYPALVASTGALEVHGSFRVAIFEGSARHEAMPWSNSPLLRLNAIPRQARDAVTAVEISWQAPSGLSTLTVGGIYWFGVWLSIDTNTDPGYGVNPTLLPLVYETTYYNTATGVESPLSPATTVEATQQTHLGQTMRLTASVGVGFDRVRFYRSVTEGSVTTRYRLGEVANAGTPTLIDKWPLDEVKAFPTYDP